jgi:hypothetical protein
VSPAFVCQGAGFGAPRVLGRRGEGNKFFISMIFIPLTFADYQVRN